MALQCTLENHYLYISISYVFKRREISCFYQLFDKDGLGSASSNKTLSQNRADSVRDFLISQTDGKELSVNAIGYGMLRPIASNKTKKGKQKNRRVELIVIQKKQTKNLKQLSPFVGVWKTKDGMVALEGYDGGKKIAGIYPTDNGKLFFTVKGRQLRGYWVEGSSLDACESKKTWKPLLGSHRTGI